MNRFTLSAIISIVVLMAFAIPGLRPAFGQEQFFGVVVRADADRQTLLVMDTRNGRKIDFSITDDTTIEDKHGIRELSDIEAGITVLIEYEESEAGPVASAVTLQ